MNQHRPVRQRRKRRVLATWTRFAIVVVVAGVVLSPVLIVVLRAVAGPAGLPSLLLVAMDPQTVHEFGVSTLVAFVTVGVCLTVGAPAGYVLSRARGRLVDVSALLVFGVQSLPSVLFLIPLFLIYARVGLVDTLSGLVLAYVGLSLAVSIWTMRAAIDAVAVDVEHAAWLDGCGVAGGFLRMVLPNAASGLVTAAVTTFLFTWNDYWIALVFVRSPENTPVGLGLATLGTPQLALLAMLPPLVVAIAFRHQIAFGSQTPGRPSF